jgi:hypothetical protein
MAFGRAYWVSLNQQVDRFVVNLAAARMLHTHRPPIESPLKNGRSASAQLARVKSRKYLR